MPFIHVLPIRLDIRKTGACSLCRNCNYFVQWATGGVGWTYSESYISIKFKRLFWLFRWMSWCKANIYAGFGCLSALLREIIDLQLLREYDGFLLCRLIKLVWNPCTNTLSCHIFDNCCCPTSCSKRFQDGHNTLFLEECSNKYMSPIF